MSDISKDLSEIILKAELRPSPYRYENLDARLDYVNGARLETIHKGIKETFGANCARAFTRMVADMPVLRPFDFIVTLGRLESQQWQWEKPAPQEKQTTGQKVLSALVHVFHADQTEKIRQDFLVTHKAELRADQQPPVQPSTQLLNFH